MVISMSFIGNGGRLGNHLFTIAATLGIAERNNATASFPEWPYEQYFKNPLPHGEMIATSYKEPHFHYNEVKLKSNTNLVGYFQSEKYFPSELPFEFEPNFRESVRTRFAHLLDKPTICLQIRRTDYVGNNFYHQIPISWYIDAMITHFPEWKQSNIIIISDDHNYCKVHFRCLDNVTFAEGLTDIEQICLMSMLDGHIIANGTFGWWGAYLSKQTKVIHCGKLFGPGVDKDSKDFYPERWIRHDNDKIDLKDCTFTIPVFYDHDDRRKNLDLSLCMIQKSFHTNVIVGEQGSNVFKYVTQYCDYVQFEGMKVFHRTRMLNEMANLAETEYIANWDCDVMIPPMQIYLTLDKLRSGVHMVYPYTAEGDSDGFARLPRQKWFGIIEKHLDIGMVGSAKMFGKGGKPVPISSVGGAVFFNKEKFIEGGMENENMVSFCPEDCERADRFQMLGYDMQRVKGFLYHMDHFIGINSSSRNPYWKAGMAELEKIRKMTRQQLRDYVNTWSWVNRYTDGYYESICEGAVRSAKEVMKLFPSVKSVVDVGCGVGEWALDNPDYVGIDKGKKKNLLIPKEQYIDCDLEKEFPVLNRKFDMCLCLEVAEHISEERADELIKYLCSLSDRVLFSAAIPNQGGNGHIQEQFQTYWAKKFEANGFGADMLYPVKKNTEVEFWYRQNMILYTNIGKMPVHDFVLPEYYKNITDYLKTK